MERMVAVSPELLATEGVSVEGIRTSFIHVRAFLSAVSVEKPPFGVPADLEVPLSFIDQKYISFILEMPPLEHSEAASVPNTLSAMMSRAAKYDALPVLVTPKTDGLTELKKDMIKLLRSEKAGWRADDVEVTGTNFVNRSVLSISV
jgi:hypothetical protein